MKILNALKTIRNNWKKSTFAACLLAYGVDYGHEKHKVTEMMREYSREIVTLGQSSGGTNGMPKRVTVILNPAANGRKATKEFEKYCTPLLHLAGFIVSVVHSDNEGQIKGLMDVMENTDYVVIAGGDGSLSEAVTGFLRRPDASTVSKNIPIGIVPLGATNQVASSIFGKFEKKEQFIAEATKAVIKGNTKMVDVMKIQPQIETPDGLVKPLFALGEVQWGAYRDAYVRRNKYWFYGPFRSNASMIFSWPRSELEWECQGQIKYLKPCSGCSRCGGRHLIPEAEEQKNKLWWQSFKSMPTTSERRIDYSKTINEECGMEHAVDVKTVDMSIASPNAVPTFLEPSKSVLQVAVGPEEVAFTEFVSEGWRRISGKTPQFNEVVTAREMWFIPKIREKKEEEVKEGEQKTETYMKWLSIDHENFELAPMHITLQPNRIKMFCPQEQV